MLSRGTVAPPAPPDETPARSHPLLRWPCMTGSGDIPSQGELTALGLSDASRLLRTRALSPVELTTAYLERIERLDPRLNAFITITAESALAQARAAEAELMRGTMRGPLHGIPIALKDLIDTAGVRTTGGSALYADRVPTRDAEVAGRLLAGGAVLLGKLNQHELAYGASSVIGHFGPVLNPWDSGRTAGGSSAGSAVAVAAELCCGAVGTDTGGSIRQPAAFCGIVGFKPFFYGAGGQATRPHYAVRPWVWPPTSTRLGSPGRRSGWGGARSSGSDRGPEDSYSRDVLHQEAGTILLSGTLWPIASFGSPGGHSL